MATKKAATRGGRSRSGVKRSTPARVRKNMDMDPAKLEAVKAIFGVSTETEAVDRALREIIFEHKVAGGLERLRSAGGLPDVDPDA